MAEGANIATWEVESDSCGLPWVGRSILTHSFIESVPSLTHSVIHSLTHSLTQGLRVWCC